MPFRLFAAPVMVLMMLIGAALFGATLLSPPHAAAHEGHDHQAPPAPPTAGSSARAEASSAAFELVVIARGAELAIYLDRFATNEPVEGATVEVETPAGPATAAPSGDFYRLNAPWLTSPGRYDLMVTVSAGDSADVLPLTLEIPAAAASGRPEARSWWLWPFLGNDAAQALAVIIAAIAAFGAGVGLMVLVRRRRPRVAVLLCLAATLVGGTSVAHEGHDHGAPAPATSAGDRAHRLPDGTLFVPKDTQRIFALRTLVTGPGVYRRTLELPGKIIPDPNASGYVQAAVGGRLAPPPGGFPRLGTPVKQGEVLAYVTPPMHAIDVSDMRQRQGELDQQIAIVERRLARYEQLVASNAVSRVQLEETRLELQGLRERRASLDHIRREPEALIAPVSGIVAEGSAVAGQMAQPNAVIFHIIDPSRLWIEALSFETIAGAEDASAKTATGRSLPLVYRGAGFADRSQSIPVHFAIQGELGGLRVGQFVTVLVVTDEKKQGIAVPRDSLVRSTNGQDFLYEHVTAERFKARPVRVEPLDGERVLVAAGIEPGKRIVTQGAELLDHLR
jgi:cobalt-zinc-cadmium efflux system membrane fusion protein